MLGTTRSPWEETDGRKVRVLNAGVNSEAKDAKTTGGRIAPEHLALYAPAEQRF